MRPKRSPATDRPVSTARSTSSRATAPRTLALVRTHTGVIPATAPAVADRVARPGERRPGLDNTVLSARTMCRPPEAGAMRLIARDHARSYHLHRLATALDSAGIPATVKTSYPAALHVFMPGASMLAESIDCVPGTDNDGRLQWYYRWSWGELLHDASEPDAAAAKIADVLSAR